MIDLLNKGLPYITVLSLALTPVSILASVYVVVIWSKASINAIKSSRITSVGWLILGVTIGFAGEIFDQLYWGAAWGTRYFSHPTTDTWFNLGVYSNTPFRQFLTIIAAGCHVRSAYVSESKQFRVFLASCWFVTIAALAVLIFV